jgi:hypothetical protein
MPSDTLNPHAYFAARTAELDQKRAATILDPHDAVSRRTIFFNPDEETAARIFQAFHSPYASLVTIAADHNTTVEGLSMWLARPEISRRLHTLKHAAASFLGLACTHRLQHAMQALTIILQEYADAACHAAGLEEGRGASPKEHNRRDRETARRASALLMRLALFNQSLRSPNERSELDRPLPRSSGGGARGSARAEGVVQAPLTEHTSNNDNPSLRLSTLDPLDRLPRCDINTIARTDAPSPTADPSDPTSNDQLLTEIQSLLHHLKSNTPTTPAPADEPSPQSQISNLKLPSPSSSSPTHSTTPSPPAPAPTHPNPLAPHAPFQSEISNFKLPSPPSPAPAAPQPQAKTARHPKSHHPRAP